MYNMHKQKNNTKITSLLSVHLFVVLLLGMEFFSLVTQPFSAPWQFFSLKKSCGCIEKGYPELQCCQETLCDKTNNLVINTTVCTLGESQMTWITHMYSGVHANQL